MAKKRISKSTKTGVRRTIAALLMVSALVVAAIPGQGIKAESEDEYEEDLTGAFGEDKTRVTAGYYIVGGIKYKVNSQGALEDISIATDDDIKWYWGKDDYEYTTTTVRNPSVSDDDYDNPNYYTTSTSAKKKYDGVEGKYTPLDPSRTTEINIPEPGTKVELQDGTYIEFPAISIIGSGSLSVFDDGPSGFYNVTKVKVPSSTRTIAKNAFKNKQVLNTVIGLDSVTEIQENAFADCINLSSCTDTGSVMNIGTHAFYNCKELKSLNLKNVQDIREYAFEKCSLTSADMSAAPKLVTIPVGCFKDCGRLTTVSLPASCKYIEKDAFYVSYYVGETPVNSELLSINMPGVERIGLSAFKDCKRLGDVKGLEKLTTIENNAFSNCSDLKSFTFPTSLYALGQNAFEECTSLEKIEFKPADGDLETVEDGETALTTIPECAFKNCTELKTLEIPNGVRTLSGKAFEGCTGLRKISLPKSLSSFSGETFSDTRNLTDLYVYNDTCEFPSSDAFVGLTDRAGFTIHGNLKRADRPDTNTNAYDYASAWTYRFVSVSGDIKESNYLVNDQGKIIYADIENLTSKNQRIVVPATVGGKTVTGIAGDVFRGTTTIISIELPKDCTQIDDRAFADCTKLSRVTIPNEGCNIGENAFNNVASDFELAGIIDEDSKPYNYAMNNTPKPIPFVSCDEPYFRVENLVGTRTLTEYDHLQTALVIPSGIDAFGKKKDGGSTYSGIFEDNDNLESITINSVKELKNHEFFGCNNLKSVSLPDTLTKMGLAPFYGCNNLADVNIDSGNKVYDCKNGIIYDNTNGEHTKILEVLAGAPMYELIIEEPVKELAEEACAGTTNLGEVYFLDGVTVIPARCFENSRILNVDLSESDVTTIRKEAFNNANYLRQMVIPPSVKEINSPVDEELAEGASVEIVGDLNSPAYYHAMDNPKRLHFKKAPDKPTTSTETSSSDSSSSDSSSSSSSTSSSSTSSSKSTSSSGKSSSSSSKSSKSSSKSSSSSSSSSTSSSSPLENVIVVNAEPDAARSARATTDNAVVDAGDSGLDDQDLISGSIVGDDAENYMIRITQTEEATAEFENALRGQYGSLDSIEYFPMDISLYDSTGTTKIENPVGISVTITIPIPDELSQYGGNNRMAAVLNSSLENLDTRFSNINDRNCVTFTATHFSPYGLYVDRDNLSADATLDSSPKTGDPISPKWFISLALAAMSLLLFFKKEPEKKLAKA